MSLFLNRGGYEIRTRVRMHADLLYLQSTQPSFDKEGFRGREFGVIDH